MVIKTHKEFLKAVWVNNKHYRNGVFKIVGKFTFLNKHIIVKTKYGDCSVTAESLYYGTNPCILSAIDKNQYFKNYLMDINPKLFKEGFNILSDFETFHNKIYVQDKYGLCLCHPTNLRHSENLSRSAVNKKEYLYNFIWDHNTWVSSGEIIIEEIKDKHCIVSDKYGKYKIKTSSLSQRNSKGTLRNSVNPTENLKNRFNEIWGDRYDYSKFKYLGSKKKSKVVCKKHGEFLIDYSKHLLGRGCYHCGKEAVSKFQKNNGNGWSPKVWKERGDISSRFTGYKFYIIKCWDENEEFYKIGKTYTDVDVRYRVKSSMPYKYKEVLIIEDTAKNISNLENIIKKKLKNFKYKPHITFNGISECFKCSEDTILKITKKQYSTF